MYQTFRYYVQILLLVTPIWIYIMALPTSSLATTNYEPPPDGEPPSGPFDSSASRGNCSDGSDISLIALAPLNHIGQVASVPPTFAWFVPNSEPLATEFQLFSYNVSGELQPLGEPIQGFSFQGLMPFTPDYDMFNLTVGDTYRWQVTIECDPSSPSEIVVIGANFRVVETSSELQNLLSDMSEPAEKYEIYAHAGYWYDAFNEALELSQDNQLGDALSELLLDLADIEEQEISQLLSEDERARIEMRINSLRLIAELDN